MSNLTALIPLLCDAGMDFVAIGGVAANMHGSAHASFDLEILYQRTPENLLRIASALAPLKPYLLGAPPGLPFVLDVEELRQGVNFTLKTTLGDLDLLGHVAGGGAYGDVVGESIMMRAFNRDVRCVSLPGLIRMKSTAGRPKDLERLAELEMLLGHNLRKDRRQPPPPMNLAFASDHAGFALKQLLVSHVQKAGHGAEDFGCRSAEGCDLSDFAAPAAAALGEGKFDRAIFVDGAGYPSGMIANMHHGVFAAVANDLLSARLAREHSGANALCIGAMVIGELMAREILDVFLKAEPLPGKYEARRDKVKAIADARRLGPLFRTRDLITLEDLRSAITRKEPLIIGEKTVITQSVVDGVKGMRA